MTLRRIGAPNFLGQLLLSYLLSDSFTIYVLASLNLTLFAGYHLTWINILDYLEHLGYPQMYVVSPLLLKI
jgi:hypothetical protein